MEAVVPWKALLDLIEPHYPKISSKGGRPPYPLPSRFIVLSSSLSAARSLDSWVS